MRLLCPASTTATLISTPPILLSPASTVHTNISMRLAEEDATTLFTLSTHLAASGISKIPPPHRPDYKLVTLVHRQFDDASCHRTRLLRPASAAALVSTLPILLSLAPIVHTDAPMRLAVEDTFRLAGPCVHLLEPAQGTFYRQVPGAYTAVASSVHVARRRRLSLYRRIHWHRLHCRQTGPITPSLRLLRHPVVPAAVHLTDILMLSDSGNDDAAALLVFGDGSTTLLRAFHRRPRHLRDRRPS